jgi:2-hydroxymuconate-semialdehyde hydrolase
VKATKPDYNAAMFVPGEASGRELLEAALRGAASPPPYVQLLGMRFTAVSDGRATFEMPATSELYNPNNVVHGGAITSLADSAMGFATFSTLASGETFTTAELHVNFLRPVTADTGMLTAIGHVVHRGTQIVVAEAEVLGPHNEVIARASSTNVILQRRPVVQPGPTEVPRTAPAPGPGAAPPMPPVQEPTPSPLQVPSVPLATPVLPMAAPIMPPPVELPPPPPVAEPRQAPPSPLERAPTPMVSPPFATKPISPAPLARTKRKIRTFAGDVAYVRMGQGPPLVLLHGIPSSSYLWRDVLEPLAQTFDVLAPDLLGYGDSDKRLDADLSIAAQARYMVAFMESVGVHQAAVVGHDVGGGVAQLMTVDDPQRVARLILIDSIVDDNWPIHEIARLKEPAWDQIMVNIDLREGLRKGLISGMATEGRVTDELVDEWTRPFQDIGGRRAYLRAARALNNRDLVSRAKHIAEITTPTLILWGANDKFLEPKWAETLQRKFRDSTVEVIDPGGHFLPLDRPDEVATAIKRFLTTR